MRTIDGFWRPGRKNAETILSDTPTVEEKEAFVIAKLDEIFKNQVGEFSVFKAEMLDHILSNIDEHTHTNTKMEFCKAYYQTYESLGGALKIRRMGYNSMHMSYKHLHRGFFFWLSQNKHAVTVMLGIMTLNVFVFDLNPITVKVLSGICLLVIVVIEIRSFYFAYYKLKDIDNVDLILNTYKRESIIVFTWALFLCNIFTFAEPFDLSNAHVLSLLAPLTYFLTCYALYIEKKYGDLSSKRTLEL